MAKKKTKAVPKLRFPEFAGQWSRITLGEMLTFKNGVNADKSQYGSGRKFVNVLDVMASAPLTNQTIVGSVNIPDAEFGKNTVEYGDILFQRSSETREDVGVANIYLVRTQPATFGGFVIRGKAVEDVTYDPMFFWNLLKTCSARDRITRLSGGSTRYNIGQESLESVPVVIPLQIEEQKRIGEFLSAIDTKIRQLEQKRELLKQYKRGVMQQIFTEKIRFKDKNGKPFPKRETKRLGEFVQLISGQHLSPEQYNDTGEIAYFTGPSDFTNNRDSIRKWALVFPNSALQGNILITVKGSGVGEVLFLEIDQVVMGRQLMSIRCEDQLTARYLFHFLRMHRERSRFVSLASGNLIPGLTRSDITLTKIPLPTPPETEAIGTFISSLDEQADCIDREAEQIKRFKTAMLQQLFA